MHTPWVSLQGSRSAACKREALRDPGAGGLTDDPSEQKHILLLSEDVCVHAHMGAGEGRPEVEGRERKATDNVGFHKWALQLPSKWECAQHWRETQNGSASIALGTPAWCQEPWKALIFF